MVRYVMKTRPKPELKRKFQRVINTDSEVQTCGVYVEDNHYAYDEFFDLDRGNAANQRIGTMVKSKKLVLRFCLRNTPLAINGTESIGYTIPPVNTGIIMVGYIPAVTSNDALNTIIAPDNVWKEPQFCTLSRHVNKNDDEFKEFYKIVYKKKFALSQPITVFNAAGTVTSPSPQGWFRRYKITIPWNRILTWDKTEGSTVTPPKGRLFLWIGTDSDDLMHVYASTSVKLCYFDYEWFYTDS